MPVMKPIDLSNVTSDFPLIEPGEYLVRVSTPPAWGEGKPGNATAGYTEITVRFVSVDGEFSGILFDRFYPDYSKAQFRWKQFLEAVGMPPEVINGRVEWDTDDLLDAEVRVQVVVQAERPNPSKPGEMYPARNNIKKFLPAHGGEVGSWAAA